MIMFYNRNYFRRDVVIESEREREDESTILFWGGWLVGSGSGGMVRRTRWNRRDEDDNWIDIITIIIRENSVMAG